LLDALPDGALLIGEHDIVLHANQAARIVLGLEPRGLSATAVIRSAAFSDMLSEVRGQGKSGEMEFSIPGSPSRHLRLFLSLLADDGTVLLLMRDLTREQRIERMRSDFVANASHEMRTPLATIIGTIETLQGAARNDAKARETFLETMLTQARQMKRLIDDLLSLSRIELNEHVLPSGRVDLMDIARQAKSNLEPLARELNVDVVLEGRGGARIVGEGDELLQVVQNLLENALKYGGAGKRAVVTVAAQGDDVALSVRDFGPGIADVHLPRLTERFYRVNTKESRARGGTGLGLAIVKHIVSRHRGRLSIHSALGDGSTFSVAFPALKQ
jgi:two-component system phosphate regulon sensor histidine kinase PhoR